MRGVTRGIHIYMLYQFDQHLPGYIQSDIAVVITGRWLIPGGSDTGERVALAGAGAAETDRGYHQGMYAVGCHTLNTVWFGAGY